MQSLYVTENIPPCRTYCADVREQATITCAKQCRYKHLNFIVVYMLSSNILSSVLVFHRAQKWMTEHLCNLKVLLYSKWMLLLTKKPKAQYFNGHNKHLLSLLIRINCEASSWIIFIFLLKSQRVYWMLWAKCCRGGGIINRPHNVKAVCFEVLILTFIATSIILFIHPTDWYESHLLKK